MTQQNGLYLKNSYKIGLLTALLVVFLNPISVGTLQASSNSVFSLPKVNLLPSSPLYFLKEWKRGIDRVFTTKPEDRIKLELKVRDERAAEIAKLKSQVGVKNETIEDAILSYTQSDDLVNKNIKTLERIDSEKAKEFSQEVLVRQEAHKDALSGLEGKISDPEVKSDLEKIINTEIDIEESVSTGEVMPEDDFDVNELHEILDAITVDFQDESIGDKSSQSAPTTPVFSIPISQGGGNSYCEQVTGNVDQLKRQLSFGEVTQSEFDTKTKSIVKDYERCLTFPQKSKAE